MRRSHAAISLMAVIAAGVGSLAIQPAAALTPSFSALPLFGLGARKPPPSLIFVYDGFQVDASGARRLQPPEKTIRALKTQIDLVEHVGLSPDILNFARTTRIMADAYKPEEPVRYVPGQGVWVKIKRLDPKKPILLAGLLEAYHDQRLSTGLVSADVTRFRNEAMTRHAWPKTALMLQSDADYFGLTGATYLYGASTREPYSRAKLRQTQPEYYRWLATLFDHGRARG